MCMARDDDVHAVTMRTCHQAAKRSPSSRQDGLVNMQARVVSPLVHARGGARAPPQQYLRQYSADARIGLKSSHQQR